MFPQTSPARLQNNLASRNALSRARVPPATSKLVTFQGQPGFCWSQASAVLLPLLRDDQMPEGVKGGGAARRWRFEVVAVVLTLVGSNRGRVVRTPGFSVPGPVTQTCTHWACGSASPSLRSLILKIGGHRTRATPESLGKGQEAQQVCALLAGLHLEGLSGSASICPTYKSSQVSGSTESNCSAAERTHHSGI